jgi:hypothetical protein
LVQNVEFSVFKQNWRQIIFCVDITYRKPVQFERHSKRVFLAEACQDAVSKIKKWTAITGVRYRNNSLLVNSQDTQTNFTPAFVDVQTNVNYQASPKWQWSF